VGEGDCILIQMPDNKNILIDSGNLSAGYKVEKYLKSIKISRLDCIIVTHMHPDHVGGLFHILPKIRTNLIYYNGYRPKKNEYFFELINLSQELKIPLKILNARKHLIYGKVHIDVLSPIEPFSGNMNEDSIVLRINFGKINILLAGDLNIRGEKRLINASTNLNSDVLKVGHHGAKDSCSEEFINKVKPKIAVLSVGRNNRYGYPSKAVIERFKIKKIPLYRTDYDGTIIIQTDGIVISIKKERD
jgi:beta-lactamase superfamily II metal-dependent hydrolase